MLVGGYRCQAKDLRAHAGLEVDHQANYFGRKLAHADARNIGVVRPNFGHQLAQRRVQADAGNVYRQARWVADQRLRGLERRVRFNRHPRIIGRRPDAHIDDARPAHQAVPQAEHNGPALHQRAPPHGACPKAISAASRPSPLEVWACTVAMRACSPSGCRAMARSAGGSTAAALSGHSASLRPGLAKMSRKPASSHSRGSLKR